jgi:hypothetical protein
MKAAYFIAANKVSFRAMPSWRKPKESGEAALALFFDRSGRISSPLTSSRSKAKAADGRAWSVRRGATACVPSVACRRPRRSQ